MKVNKIAAFTGIVMALSAGVAQAVSVPIQVAISASVLPAMVGCTVQPSNAVSLAAITLGGATATLAPMSVTATCAAATPYNITFQSGNSAPGVTGRLLDASGTCSLNYAVVSRGPTGIYGISDYFVSPQAVGGLTGTGAAQGANFGIKVETNQPGCSLPPNTPAVTVNDVLTVSVNY